MRKIFSFKILVTAFTFVVSSSALFAQDEVIRLGRGVVDDSLKVPGYLFNLSKYTATGAIATVTSEEIKQYPSPNITNTLYGRLPGLTVTQGSGEPGNDGASLAIRGVGTTAFTNLYNNYTVFVDGFEVKQNYFNYLQPEEIETISIFKDASSLVQFGMHSDNGVIWIVTKRGKAGKTKFTFQTHTGVQTPIVLEKPLRGYNFEKLYNIAKSNDNNDKWSPTYTTAQLQAYDSGKGIDVDWYKQNLRNAGAYSDGTFTFSGGDSKILYSTVIGYTNQQGLFSLHNTDTTANESFQKINIRTNLDFNVLKIFDARMSLVTRLENRKSPNYSVAQSFNDIANYPSNIYNVYTDSTKQYFGYNSSWPNNPYATIAAQGLVSSRTRFLQGNFGLREKLDFITTGLYIDESVSFNSMGIENNSNTKAYAHGNIASSDYIPSNQTAAGQDDWKQGELVLGYNHQFGNHHIVSAVNYLASSDMIGSAIYNFKNNYINISGNTNYSYKDKYIADFAFSYFGSDNFNTGNQYRFYPAISAAWILSKEVFVQKLLPFVNFLKLRASAGICGSDGTVATFTQAGNYLYQQFYNSNANFYQGGDNNGTPTSSGNMNPLYIASPGFQPEKSKKINIGTDLTVFNKFTLSADIYIDYRTNIPTANNFIPGYFGNVLTYSNVGAANSKGLETMLSYTDKIGKVKFTLFSTVSLNTSKVIVSGATPVPYAANSAVGKPIGTPIGLIANGLYQTTDFNADGTLKSTLPKPTFGTVQPGDIKYKDLNGDSIVDNNDVAPIGKSTVPTCTYSFGANFTYKHFDFGFVLQGAANASVNLLSSAIPTSMFKPLVGNNTGGNAFANANSAWAYYPNEGIDTRATAVLPRLSTQNNVNNYPTTSTSPSSSFWYKNNDFLRVRNIEIGYNLSDRYLSKYGLSQFRIFINTTNPFTFSKFLKTYHLDPESLGGYPALKTVSIGLTTAF